MEGSLEENMNDKEIVPNKIDDHFLAYDLSPEYFIDKDVYFKCLADKCHSKFPRTFFKLNSIYVSEDFTGIINTKDILKRYYEKAISYIKINKSKGAKVSKKDDEPKKKEQLWILKNGISFYNNHILLYCVKSEEVVNDIVYNLKLIESIDHNEYNEKLSKDKSQSNKSKFSDFKIKTEKVKSAKKPNSIFKVESDTVKSTKTEKIKNDKTAVCQINLEYKVMEKNKISGIKNRAIALESLVNYYFKNFKVCQIPDLIINLNYQSTKILKKKEKKIIISQNLPSEHQINLFLEWDGCFLYKGNEDIFFPTNDDPRPFYKQKTFRINFNENSQEINNNIMIKNNSFIFMEVKTHFPKEEEEDKNNSLENIIKVMFIKLNYFIGIYKEIIKNELNTIKIILLYNQNKLKNYEKIILTYIDKYKTIFRSENYELYFDILYILPSIGKLTLDTLSKHINDNYAEIKELKIKNNKLIDAFQQLVKDLTKQNIKIDPNLLKNVSSLYDINNKELNNKNIEVCNDPKYLEIKNKIKNQVIISKSETIYQLIYENCQKKFNNKNFSLNHYKNNHTDISEIFHDVLRIFPKEDIIDFFKLCEFQYCNKECSEILNSKGI